MDRVIPTKEELVEILEEIKDEHQKEKEDK
jgi:hypothetical protein